MATKTKSAGADTIYQMVTDRIVAALEAGTVPWQKPWRVSGLHRNFNSKRPYRGINQFILDMVAADEGYSSPYWITYKKLSEAGGTLIQKPDAEKGTGQSSTPVVFWKMNRWETNEVDDKGNKVIKTIPMLRYFNVFNTDQVEGIDVPEVVADDFSPIEAAQAIVDNMPNRPKLSHGGDRAFYHPAKDSVRLPKQAQFLTPEAYYATAFHELVHSTGHDSRLNRPEVMDLTSFGDDPYAREELVAEMGAAMLCGLSGIDATFDNSAAYVASWLKRIKDDKKLIIGAAGKAQAAADYILDTKFDNKDN